MHLDLDGEKTHKVYEAFGRQPLAQYGPVEYEEFDDRNKQRWLPDITGRRDQEGCHRQ
jgi:hypothetical protein